MPGARLSPTGFLLAVAWVIIAAFTIFDVLSPGVWLDMDGIYFAALGLLLALALAYRRRSPRIALITQTLALGIVTPMVMIWVSYHAAEWQRPFVDSAVLSFDHAVRFDWIAYCDWLTARPLLFGLCTFCYSSFFGEILIAFVWFGWREPHQAARFALALILASAFSSLLFGLYPVHDAGTAYGLDVEPGASWSAMIDLLRAHALAHAPPKGLVSFPSFHTAAAVMMICFFRNIPVRLWNVLMIFAIPVLGLHHLADVMGGIATALLSIYAVNLLETAHRRYATPDSLPNSMP